VAGKRNDLLAWLREQNATDRHEGLATPKESAAMNEVPIMQVRGTEKGVWFVAAEWPSGHTEEVKSFPTESDANRWVAEELQTWLYNRKEMHHA
jgi:hypothetical protein